MSISERSVIGGGRPLSSTGEFSLDSELKSGSRGLNPVSTLSEAVEACVRDCLLLQSSDVHVEVDFGCSSFRVIDNGRGLSKEDLRVCASGGGPVEGRNIGLGSVCVGVRWLIFSRGSRGGLRRIDAYAEEEMC